MLNDEMNVDYECHEEHLSASMKWRHDQPPGAYKNNNN